MTLAVFVAISRWEDVVRVIGMLLGIFSVGLMIGVCFEAARFRIPPVHTLVVCIGYGMLQLSTIWEIHSRFGADFTWRTPMETTASGVMVIGVLMMGKYYRYSERMKRHKAMSDSQALRLLAEAKEKQEKGKG